MRHNDGARLRQRPRLLQDRIPSASSTERATAQQRYIPKPIATRISHPGHGAAATDQAARKMIEALVPPNPKLLDNATLIRRF